jgi:hypothetical protein
MARRRRPRERLCTYAQTYSVRLAQQSRTIRRPAGRPRALAASSTQDGPVEITRRRRRPRAPKVRRASTKDKRSAAKVSDFICGQSGGPHDRPGATISAGQSAASRSTRLAVCRRVSAAKRARCSGPAARMRWPARAHDGAAAGASLIMALVRCNSDSVTWFLCVKKNGFGIWALHSARFVQWRRAAHCPRWRPRRRTTNHRACAAPALYQFV